MGGALLEVVSFILPPGSKLAIPLFRASRLLSAWLHLILHTTCSRSAFLTVSAFESTPSNLIPDNYASLDAEC